MCFSPSLILKRLTLNIISAEIIQRDDKKCKGCNGQKGIALGGLNLVSMKSSAVKKHFRNC